MLISAGNGLGDTTGTELPIHMLYILRFLKHEDPKCSLNPVKIQVRMQADPDLWCFQFTHAIKFRNGH